MLIDVREPGLWTTLVSYHQSVKIWEKETNPIYKRAADKEKERYAYLKRSLPYVQ